MILILDNEIELCLLLQSALKLRTFQSLIATSLDEAIRIIKNNPQIDLVVSDVILSGDNPTGFEIVKYHHNVIFVTSSQRDDVILQLSKEGKPYLLKPFDLNRFFKVINEQLATVYA